MFQLVRFLVLHDLLLNGTVRRKVDGLITALTQHGRHHALVQGTNTFFTDNRHGRLEYIRVLAMLHLRRINHGVILRLHTDFAHFGGCDHHNGFGQSRKETCSKGNP